MIFVDISTVTECPDGIHIEGILSHAHHTLLLLHSLGLLSLVDLLRIVLEPGPYHPKLR